MKVEIKKQRPLLEFFGRTLVEREIRERERGSIVYRHSYTIGPNDPKQKKS